jgi:hypothetical protein
MTTARDALRTTSIFRFRTLTNNLFIRNNLNQGCTHPYVTRYADYTVCTTWLRLFLHEPNKNWDQSLIIYAWCLLYHCWSFRVICLEYLGSSPFCGFRFSHLYGFLCCIMLWVLFVFVLCIVFPMLPVFLDCPLLIDFGFI